MTRARSARSQTYAVVIGVAVGMALTGLALPWVVGDSAGTQQAVAEGSSPGTEAVGSLEASGLETGTSAVDGTAANGTGGPTSSGGPRATSEGTTAGPATGGGGATDVGVTPTSVKLGFLLLDLGGVSKIGIAVPGVDPEQQKEAIQIHVDSINRAGGIAGRRIEPVYRSFDVLNPSDMRAACLALTEDGKVFAALAFGGYLAVQGLCFTQEHKTPLVLHCCAIDDYFAQSEGRMFSLFAGSSRLTHMWVHELDRTGRLRGKTVGVLSDERNDPGQRMAKTGLIPAMQKYGYSIAHLSRLSDDVSVAASQIPNEVQQMRLKGVDTVLLMTAGLYAQQFAQHADAQGWRPTYLTSDWGGMNTDSGSDNMPESYDKTFGWTVGRGYEWRSNIPESEPATVCRTRFETAAGRKAERNDDSREYAGVIMWCDLLEVMVSGLRGAGANLTRARLSEAIQNTRTIPLGTIGGGGYRPGRFDAADVIRLQQWHLDCRCWRPLEPFRPTPY